MQYCALFRVNLGAHYLEPTRVREPLHNTIGYIRSKAVRIPYTLCKYFVQFGGCL